MSKTSENVVKTYDYISNMRDDIIETIDNLSDEITQKVNPFECTLKEWLEEVCIILDEMLYDEYDVTGIKTGSHTLNIDEAKYCVLNNNLDLEYFAIKGYFDFKQIGALFARQSWEALDVLIRTTIFEYEFQHHLTSDDDIKCKLVSIYLDYIERYYTF